jgi:hypothetical protein
MRVIHGEGPGMRVTRKDCKNMLFNNSNLDLLDVDTIFSTPTKMVTIQPKFIEGQKTIRTAFERVAETINRDVCDVHFFNFMGDDRTIAVKWTTLTNVHETRACMFSKTFTVLS